MTISEMAARIEASPAVLSVAERYGNQLELRVEPAAIVSTLSLLKASGFEHLSNLLAVDWIEEGEFELVYNLFSYQHRLHVTMKTRIDRASAHAPTILALWPQGQIYEREVHEFFGIVFDGNPDLAPFFLHNWQDMPPLRKDFDTREYSRRAYGMLDEESEPPTEAGAAEEQTR